MIGETTTRGIGGVVGRVGVKVGDCKILVEIYLLRLLPSTPFDTYP